MNEMTEKYYLNPGCIFVSKEPYLVHTVLGSCISVCLWDPHNKIGAMNHYIYDSPKNNERTARFGSISIPHLIKLILENGAEKHNLRAHIVGGSNNPELKSDVGDNNIKIAENILQKYDIEIITRDLGGYLGRKVIFNNINGEVLVYKCNSIRSEDWYK